jgi:gamma-glutamyltranspeptidase/glutathione hydrolase
MAPTIILEGEKLFMVLGTRGGPAIPTTVLQVFLNVAVHGKTLAEAVSAPRYHHQATPDEVRYERGRADMQILRQLNEIGHGVREDDPIGDVHAIRIGPEGIDAVADGRDGGAAGGY